MNGPKINGNEKVVVIIVSKLMRTGERKNNNCRVDVLEYGHKRENIFSSITQERKLINKMKRMSNINGNGIRRRYICRNWDRQYISSNW